MTPPEVLPEGPTLFLTMPPPAGTSGGFKGRGKRAEKRKKREERREKMAASSIHCISTVSRDHLDENPKITNERPRVSFAEMLKSRGRHEHGRKLDSLHFCSVP